MLQVGDFLLHLLIGRHPQQRPSIVETLNAFSMVLVETSQCLVLLTSDTFLEGTHQSLCIGRTENLRCLRNLFLFRYHSLGQWHHSRRQAPDAQDTQVPPTPEHLHNKWNRSTTITPQRHDKRGRPPAISCFQHKKCRCERESLNN